MNPVQTGHESNENRGTRRSPPLVIMFIFLVICPIFISSIRPFEFVDVDEALDYWKEVVSSTPHLLSELKKLVNEDVPRKEMILKVGIWSKERGLGNEFSHFVRKQRQLYKSVYSVVKINDVVEDEISKFIHNMTVSRFHH